MTLRPDDPKLTSWLLGELTVAEAEEVQRAVAADTALQLAVHDLERVLKLLSNTLAPQQVELFPRQKNLILQEARRMDAPSQVLPMPKSVKTPVSWFFPMAAAAVLAFACWLLIQLPGGDSSRTAGNAENPNENTAPDAGYWPKPAPADGTPVVMPTTQSTMDARPHFPVLIPRGALNPAENPVLKLPVSAGDKSLAWVQNAIRKENSLPHPHAVRLEEILNQFPLRPSGPAALAKGVALTTEAVACPWNPAAQLLIVSLRGAPADARDVTMSFHPNPSLVRSYRLLGYAHAQGAAQETPSTKLAAGGAHSLVIELQSSADAGSFGSIQWTVDGQDAAVIEVARRSDARPSEDACFASLVVAGSLWLADRSTPVDVASLTGMIRDVRPSSAERADFLRLLEQALTLAAK